MADFSGRETTLKPELYSRPRTGMGQTSSLLSCCASCKLGTADIDARLVSDPIGSGDVVRTGGVTVSVEAGEIG